MAENILEGTIEIPETDVKLVVNTELAKFNIAERIESAKALAAEHDHPILSGAMLESAKNARRQLRNTRLNIEKVGEHIRSSYHQQHKLSVSITNEAVNAFREPEALVDGRIKEYEAEVERKKNEAAAARRAIIEQRHQAMEELGFAFTRGDELDKDRYTVNGTTLYVEVLETASPEEWENRFRSLRMIAEEYRAKQEAKAEAEKAEKERKDAELKAMIEERASNRREVMQAMGATLDGKWWMWGSHMIVNDEAIGAHEVQEWNQAVGLLREYKQAEESKIAHAKAVAERDALNAQRRDELLALGAVIGKFGDSVGVDGDNNWKIELLAEFGEAGWSELLVRVRDAVRAKKEREEAEAQRKEQERQEELRVARVQGERGAQLAAIERVKRIGGVYIVDGLTLTPGALHLFSDADWEEEMARWKKASAHVIETEQRAAREQEEADRAAAAARATDAEKLSGIADSILALKAQISVVPLKSKEAQHALSRTVSNLEDMQRMLRNVIK